MTDLAIAPLHKFSDPDVTAQGERRARPCLPSLPGSRASSHPCVRVHTSLASPCGLVLAHAGPM